MTRPVRTLVDKLEDVPGTKLSMWVITQGTSDHGFSFVVRRHAVLCDASARDGSHLVERDCTLHETLDGARGVIPKNLVRIPPTASDDRVVVETWL